MTDNLDARILIIDDEPANVALLEQLLRRRGYTNLIGITQARQGVDHYRDNGADLVLLDLHMPDLDGYAVLAQIQSLQPAEEFLPLVVITADATAETRRKALSSGATDFIIKPIDATDVELRVANLLRTRALHELVLLHNRSLQNQLREHADRAAAEEGRRRLLVQRVEGILAAGGPAMVFQPILDLRNGRLAGCEALARFPNGPHAGPEGWFADAAEVGLHTELECAAVAQACRHLDALPPGSYLSVNMSPASAIATGMCSALPEVDLSRIVLELTEHTRIEDYEEVRAAFRDLRAAGMRLAIDDAGAGFASLQHVLRLQPDIIKLDRALVSNIDEDPARRALAAALVGFAQEIDASITAEGIETAAELAAVRDLGVSFGQGFHLGRPVRLAEVTAAGALLEPNP